MYVELTWPQAPPRVTVKLIRKPKSGIRKHNQKPKRERKTGKQVNGKRDYTVTIVACLTCHDDDHNLFNSTILVVLTDHGHQSVSSGNCYKNCCEPP